MQHPLAPHRLYQRMQPPPLYQPNLPRPHDDGMVHVSEIGYTQDTISNCFSDKQLAPLTSLIAVALDYESYPYGYCGTAIDKMASILNSSKAVWSLRLQCKSLEGRLASCNNRRLALLKILHGDEGPFDGWCRIQTISQCGHDITCEAPPCMDIWLNDNSTGKGQGQWISCITQIFASAFKSKMHAIAAALTM